MLRVGDVPEDAARVFFALWPDAILRADLVRCMARLHARFGGRRMRPDSLHLTLVFVSRIESRLLPHVLAMAEALRMQGFITGFDREECWRRNRIGCLGASRVPTGLGGLVHALEDGLRDLRISFEHRPYRPHVTLLRNADCTRRASPVDGSPPNATAPAVVAWPARDFVLVKSSLRPDGARYEELGRWPLL